MLPAGKTNSISKNGNARPRLPIRGVLPRIEAPQNESLVDISLLDVMGIEEWLSLLKGKTDNNSRELWKETCILALQLKASRELLSIGSNLFSNKSNRKILDRLIEATYVILGAERVYLLEIEPTGKELIVTHTREDHAIGLKMNVTQGIEGDVVIKRNCANVPDVTIDPRYVPTLEPKTTGHRTRCMVCAPIITDGVVIGVIQATNKIVRGVPRLPGDDFSELSFSANDATLLSFIATNAGLALKQSALRQSMPGIAPLSFDPSIRPAIQKMNNDTSLQRLVEATYSRLEAERISIFTFNSMSGALVCMVSKDIQGTIIPVDKGFAGLAFTSMRVINVADAKQDERHNRDVDARVGFTTRSLLCAPILGVDGMAVGVVQAINKINGPKFTLSDEEHIREICKSMNIHFSGGSGEKEWQKASLPPSSPPVVIPPSSSAVAKEPGALTEDAVNLTRSVANMILSGSLEELVLETESVVKSFTDCDFVGVYALDGVSLYRVKALTKPLRGDLGAFKSNSNSKTTLHRDHSSEIHFEFLSLADLPQQIKQALQFKSVVEFSLPADQIQMQPGYILPDLKAYQALIFPMLAKAYSYEPGGCTLIVANTEQDRPFSDALRETLEVIADYFNRALQTIYDRCTQEDSMRTLKSNFNLVNNTLGVLKDYVILLNSEGNLVACNKMLEDLLGKPARKKNGHTNSDGKHSESKTDLNLHLRDSPHEHGSSNNQFEGQHYSAWLAPSNSPELCRDIANALLSGRSKSQEIVKFISPVYAEGVYMDYQVVFVENPDSASEGPIYSPRSPRGNPSASDELDTNSTFAVVVIVQIHSEKIPRHPTTGGFLNGITVPHVTLSHLDTHSAHGVVDAATSIINNVRNSFDIDPEIHESLKQISHHLSDASRRLSLCNASQSAVSLALQSIDCPLVHPQVTLPSDMHEWEFDVTEIKDGMVLCSVIGQLFSDLFDLNEMQIDSSSLSRFIIEVGKNYHDRPFHNLQHATCVTHFAYMLMKATNAKDNLKPHQLFGILVSAVVHDVDHPGNTNLFEINSSSDLALRYNDQSVLENHHCSTAFRLMRNNNMQILSKLPKAIAVDIRKIIISCVMATDMAVHFELIDETKKRAVEGWNFSEVKDQSLLGKILLHAADLSNPVRPFHMTRRWAERISMEFNDQVTREQALGMPVLGFMMTPDEKAFCKNETGFASFVVAPMWRAIASLYPNLSFLVAQLDSNLLTWKATLEKLQAEEQEKAAAAAAAAALAENNDKSA